MTVKISACGSNILFPSLVYVKYFAGSAETSKRLGDAVILITDGFKICSLDQKL